MFSTYSEKDTLPLINTLIFVCSTGDALAFTLKAFVELMDHGIVSWDVLQHKFIKNVRHIILGDEVALMISVVFVCLQHCVHVCEYQGDSIFALLLETAVIYNIREV